MSKNERQRLLQHGFLGPIGDDIPSLIPIVFALFIFFSTFSFALNAFNTKKADFDTQILALRIANNLKQDNYYPNFERFEELCKKVGVGNVKYRAGLVEVGSMGSFDVFKSHEQGAFYVGNGREYRCENTSEELNFNRVDTQKPSMKSFPVSLNENLVVRPMILVVVIWT